MSLADRQRTQIKKYLIRIDAHAFAIYSLNVLTTRKQHAFSFMHRTSNDYNLQ